MFRKITVTMLMIGFVAGGVYAQSVGDPVQLALQYSKNMEQNMIAMRQYSWKSRTEVRAKGETQAVTLHLVRFDLDGNLQKTPIGGEQKSKKKRGIKGKIQKKKQKKARAMGQNIAELVKAYTFPSTGTMVDFFQQGRITPGPATMSGVLQIKGKNFLRPGDTATMWVEQGTLRPRKFQFRTVLGEDQDPVEGTVEYRTLASGSHYPARTVVKIPTKGMQAAVENFDHVRQGQ